LTDITHRTVKTNGIHMHIAEQGEGPLVLMLHGFPESWYSWRHQLPALAAAGYHAVAPDVRGYGRSDRPHEIEAYAMREHLADAIGLVDALGEKTAVIVGHDWGAPMAWNAAALHPDRFPAVAGLSVPYTGRSPIPPTQLLKGIFGDNFFYMLYFQEPGPAEEEFEADVRKSMRMFMYGAAAEGANEIGRMANKKKGDRLLTGMVDPETLPAWLTEDDFNYFAGEFERTGFRGALNRYRNIDRDWEQLPELATAKITQPALFIGGEKDPVLRFAPPLEGMTANVPNVEIVKIPDAGHWTQQEAPGAVNEALLKFLGRLT
jgi:pimeloyl-ACP methyl ester carboxylesterase